jgi:hypothetical protein
MQDDYSSRAQAPFIIPGQPLAAASVQESEQHLSVECRGNIRFSKNRDSPPTFRPNLAIFPRTHQTPQINLAKE